MLLTALGQVSMIMIQLQYIYGKLFFPFDTCCSMCVIVWYTITCACMYRHAMHADECTNT